MNNQLSHVLLSGLLSVNIAVSVFATPTRLSMRDIPKEKDIGSLVEQEIDSKKELDGLAISSEYKKIAQTDVWDSLPVRDKVEAIYNHVQTRFEYDPQLDTNQVRDLSDIFSSRNISSPETGILLAYLIDKAKVNVDLSYIANHPLTGNKEHYIIFSYIEKYEDKHIIALYSGLALRRMHLDFEKNISLTEKEFNAGHLKNAQLVKRFESTKYIIQSNQK